jgi:hypothetical protein
MGKPLNRQITGELLTPRQIPPFHGKLELICKSCGAKGKYKVGRIIFSLHRVNENSPQEALEEGLGFSALVRCPKCKAGGPWGLPTKSLALLVGLLSDDSQSPQEKGIQFGLLQMFDGTLVRSAVEAEEHLKKLIAANPEDYFLWSRLGNVYDSAEEDQLAMEAFHKAVELNPLDVESHHSLGNYYLVLGQREKAAHHYHQVLLHCQDAPARTKAKPKLLRGIVRYCLEDLFDLHNKSRGKIDFFPPPPPLPPDAAYEKPVLMLREFDLSSEKGWEKLTDMFLEPRPPLVDRIKEKVSSWLPSWAKKLPEIPLKVGRNDPCICGSGKKFKHCCGKR